MHWDKTNPGVWESSNGFKVLQAGRSKFICTLDDWQYVAPTLAEAQTACRSMSMTAWFSTRQAA